MDLRSTEMGIVPIGEVTMTWLKSASLREKEKRRKTKESEERERVCECLRERETAGRGS